MNKEKKLITWLDKEEIKEVVTNWAFWRDKKDFKKMAACFWPEAQITVSFHSGTIREFIDKCSHMGGTAHFVGAIRVDLNGERAIAESNTIVMARLKEEEGETDMTTFLRFYDQFEKRQAEWRILERTAVYEKDRFDPVATEKYDPAGAADRFPQSCKHLCLALRPLQLELPLDKIIESRSDQEQQLIKYTTDWLLEPSCR